jgi:hypothetical protein
MPPYPWPLTWGQRLLQLVSLVGVLHTQGVQVPAAADLELCDSACLLDLHGLGILPTGCQKEVLDLVNLLRLRDANKNQVSALAGGGVHKRCASQLRPYHLVQCVQRHNHGRKGETVQMRLRLSHGGNVKAVKWRLGLGCRCLCTRTSSARAW